MALLWADGFDHYGNAGNMTLGSYLRADVAMTTDPNKVRTGATALDVTGGDNVDRGLLRPVTIQGETIGIGFAILTTSNPPPGGRFQYRVNDVNGNPIILAAFNGNLGIDIICDGVTLVSTPPLVLVAGSYSYVEFGFTLDPTQGRVIVRVNNSVVADVSDLNTIGGDGTGVPYSSGFYKPGGVSSTWPSWYIDDYVVWDASGALNNFFFGDIRCRTLYPEANGINQNWNANGAAQNQAFQCLRQVPPAVNVEYLSAANVGDLSSFNLDAVPINTGAVYGVMVFSNMNKADAGVCGIEAGIGSGGATDMGPIVNPGTGAAFYSRAIDADPNGGVAWTKDSVNAMQALIERVQ